MYFWRDEADFMNDMNRLSVFYISESRKNSPTKTNTQVSKKQKPVARPWYESDSEEERNFYSYGRGRKYDDVCPKYELQGKIQMQVRHTVGNRYSNEALEAYYNVCQDDAPDTCESPIQAPKEVSIEFAREQKQLEIHDRAEPESNYDVCKDVSSSSSSSPKKLSIREAIRRKEKMTYDRDVSELYINVCEDDSSSSSATPRIREAIRRKEKMTYDRDVSELYINVCDDDSSSSSATPRKLSIREALDQKQMKTYKRDDVGITSAPKNMSIKEAVDVSKKDSPGTTSPSSCRMPKKLTMKEARKHEHASPESHHVCREGAPDARSAIPYPSPETMSITEAKEQTQMMIDVMGLTSTPKNKSTKQAIEQKQKMDDVVGFTSEQQLKSDNSTVPESYYTDCSEEASDARAASPRRSPKRSFFREQKQVKREWAPTLFKNSVANNIEISCSKLAEEKFCPSEQSSSKKKTVQDRLNRR